MENDQFEDVFPSDTWDFPWPCLVYQKVLPWFVLFVAGNSGCSPGLDALLRTIQVVSGGFDAGPTEILSLLLTMWSQIKDLNRENPGKLKMFDVSFCMFFYDFFFFGGGGRWNMRGHLNDYTWGRSRIPSSRFPLARKFEPFMYLSLPVPWLVTTILVLISCLICFMREWMPNYFQHLWNLD